MRKAEPLEGQHLLMNGAGGGVGTIAIQLARQQGATVTAVDRADKLDLLRSLGAERVIDYQREDFARTGHAYDVIIDVVMRRSLVEYHRALADNGRFVVVGGSTLRIAQTVLLGRLLGRGSGKRHMLLIHRPNRQDLESLGRMVASGQIAPVIDRTWPLEQLPEAFRSFAAGNARGKVVISVAD